MFAEVVFPLPFRNSFTYKVPAEFEDVVSLGVRVVAPFQKKVYTGFVISTSPEFDGDYKVKELHDVLDDSPIFDETGLQFYKWLSDYYLCSIGEALKLSIPFGTSIESKRKIVSDKEVCQEFLEKEKNQNSIKAKILAVLCKHSVISLSTLQKAVKQKNIYSALKQLEKEGVLSSVEELKGAQVKPRKVKYVNLKMTLEELYMVMPELERKSPARVRVILELIKVRNELPASVLLKQANTDVSALKGLYKAKIIDVYDKEVSRSYVEGYTEPVKNITLTEKQQGIVDKVSANLQPFSFKPYLLYGVTGSGKTQVYIELIKKVLELGKNAIFLVPEISLTPQVTTRLINSFGNKVSVLHSRMSPGERFDAWRNIKASKTKVVVGARSALFAPVKDCGIIIVDEEHDSSYKQADTPRYNGRDAAIMLAKILNIPVILGSATPSLESFYNATQGKYDMLTLDERVDNAKLPVIALINVTKNRVKQNRETIFSPVLIERIEDKLKKKEGVIILQNRRGFSTQIYCQDCGEVEMCDNCSVPMVFHIHNNYISCHYCGLTKKVPGACTHCGSLNIKYFGTGTEKVEDELAFLFPEANIARVDSDSISKKQSLSTILASFAKGDIDIMVGTQMVSKGLDFSRVTLVGVVAAETTLWMPDFRADERTFSLLTQVSGRAGRSQAEGEVIIQTLNPNQFVLAKVVANDYEGFYEKEMILRERNLYPPFSRLCLIEAKDLDERKAEGAIKDLYSLVNRYKQHLIITPPTAAMIARIKGFYRFHIIIKTTKDKDPSGNMLRTAILNSYIEFNKKSRYSDVKIIFDVDPINII